MGGKGGEDTDGPVPCHPPSPAAPVPWPVPCHHPSPAAPVPWPVPCDPPLLPSKHLELL